MSIQKTIFGVATPYQKQKYDGNLSLERAPDLSEQASRNHLANVEQLQQQYNIDKTARDLENDIAENVAKHRVPPANTFLSKLAPFSDIIKSQLEAAEKGFDEWRDKQATDDARRKIRFQEVFGMSQEVLEATWTKPTIDKLRENPEYDALFTSKLFSNDPGIERRRGTAKVKLFTQSADNIWERWSNSPDTKIEVHDGQGGTREISPFQVTTAAEAEAVLKAWDLHVDSYFAEDPEGVQQQAQDAVRKKRGQFAETLYKNVRSLSSQRAMGGWSQSLYAGMPLQTVIQGIAETGDLKGGKARLGPTEAMKLVMTDFKSGYKSGHFSYNTVVRWAKEGSGFYKNGKEQTMLERYPTMFSDMVNYMEETDQAKTTQFFTTNKQKAKQITLELAQKLASGDVIIEDAELHKTARVLELLGVVNDPILKQAFETNSVSALQEDAFEKHYDDKFAAGFFFPDENAFHTAFHKFPGLKTKFQALDKARRAANPLAPDENYKTELAAGRARLSEITGDLDPKSVKFLEGGAGLAQLPNGGMASSAGVIIEAEITKRMKYEIEKLMLGADEEIVNGIGQTSKNNYYQLGVINAWNWFRQEMIKKGGRFEYTNGQFPNVNRPQQSPSNTLVITRAEQEKLNKGLGATFNTYRTALVNKYGVTGDAGGKAIKDKELISILYTDREMEEAVQRFEQGESPTVKTSSLLALMGVNSFTGYQTLINTMAGRKVLGERPGYKIYSQVVANVDLDPWLNGHLRSLQHSNPSTVQRGLQALRGVTPALGTLQLQAQPQLPTNDPEAEVAAALGAAGGPDGAMSNSTTGAAEGMQGNEGTITGQVEINNKVYARVQQLIEDLLPKYKGNYQQAIAEAQRLWREATGNPNFTIE
jgi:hypothetical protein